MLTDSKTGKYSFLIPWFQSYKITINYVAVILLRVSYLFVFLQNLSNVFMI